MESTFYMCILLYYVSVVRRCSTTKSQVGNIDYPVCMHNINNKQWQSGWDLRSISLMVCLIPLSTAPSSGIGLISALRGSLGYKTAGNKYIMFGDTAVCKFLNVFSKCLHNAGVIPIYIYSGLLLVIFIINCKYKLRICQVFCMLFDEFDKFNGLA